MRKQNDIEQEKRLKILDLYFLNIDDVLIQKFFDLESDKMLDLKIRVLEERAAGKKASEIKGYYSILEKYPKSKKNKDGTETIINW